MKFIPKKTLIIAISATIVAAGTIYAASYKESHTDQLKRTISEQEEYQTHLKQENDKIRSELSILQPRVDKLVEEKYKNSAKWEAASYIIEESKKSLLLIEGLDMENHSQ